MGVFMTSIKSLVASLALAGVALASGTAGAADISQGVQTLTLGTGATVFGHSIDMGNSGGSFSDHFNFSTTSAFSLGGLVSAFTASDTDAIQITGLTLYNSGGMSVGGVKVLDGQVDLWKLSSSHLVADNYSLLVSGKVLSSAATAYSGSLTVSAVPEPATYGMLLAGMGLVGFIRRR